MKIHNKDLLHPVFAWSSQREILGAFVLVQKEVLTMNELCFWVGVSVDFCMVLTFCGKTHLVGAFLV
jgi:hypothetical protein